MLKRTGMTVLLLLAALQTAWSAGGQAPDYVKGCQLARLRIGADRTYQEGNRSFLLVHGKATAVSVLLLHGFSAGPFETRELGEYLFKQGFNVYCPRLAGHGGGREDFDQTLWTQWLDSAKDGFGIARLLGERTAIVSHSMGGLLACMLAEKQPDQVAALVLAAPAFRLVDWRARFSTWPPVRWLVPEVKFKPQDEMHQKYWILTYSSFEVSQLVRAQRAAQKTLPGLKMPVMMLQAAEDPLISRPANERLFTKIGSQDKRFLVYPSQEHNVVTSNNPLQAQVFGWIGGFLKEIQDAKGAGEK